MYEPPVFTKINIYEYRRVLAMPTEIAAQPEYRPPANEIEALERELDGVHEMLRQLRDMRRTLDTKVFWIQKRLRAARRRVINVGWPLVERRRVPREK